MKFLTSAFAVSFTLFFSNTPIAFAQVIIDNQQTLNGTSNNIGGQLIYVGYSTPNGRYNIINGGKFSTNSFGYLGYGYNSKGIVNVSGKGSAWTSQAGLYVGYLGNGEFTVINGASALSNNTIFGGSSLSTGKGLVSGVGSVWTGYGLILGWANGATGYLNVENGGQFIASSPASGVSVATLGDDTNAKGYLTVTGQNSAFTVGSGNLTVANYGTGELKITDAGIVEVLNGKIELGKENGSSGHIIIGDDTSAKAAGYLNVNNIDFKNGKAQLTFNHTDDSYIFAPVLTSIGTGTHQINHLAGTTLFTTNSAGFNGNSYVSGGEMMIASTGKLGGSLAKVTGGSFIVDGQYLGAVTAQTGGTITGSGKIDKDVTIADGILKGTLGNQLTIGGDLILNADSQVNVELGIPSNSALFNIEGNLTLAGKINVTDMGGFGVGVYRIMDYQGTLTDQTMTIGSAPTNYNLNISTNINNQINLISTNNGNARSPLEFWNGDQTGTSPGLQGGDGQWTATTNNWTDYQGSQSNQFVTGTYSVFAGNSGVVNIVDNPLVSGLQFLSDGYVIEDGIIHMQANIVGSGQTIIRVDNISRADSDVTATIASQLDGDVAIVKEMAGTLILSGNNSYTGGTIIRDGTLQISTDSNLGIGNITFNGLGPTKETLRITDNITTERNIILTGTSYGRIAVDDGVTYQVDGNVLGKGQLVKQGAGRLELTSTANNYTRNWIDEGTLAGSSQTLKGEIIFSDSPDAVVELNETSNNTLSNAIAGFVDGKVVQQGTVVKKGAGELTYDGISLVDWQVEEGKVITTTKSFRGNADISAGTEFHFNQSYDGTYAGQFSGTGNIILNDAGTLNFSGDSSAFAGNTNIQTGTLLINKNAALGGIVTAQAGATLGGNGRVGNAVITNGGSISPGENGIGTLTVDNNLTMAQGSIYDVEVKSDLTTDLIKVGGHVDIQGGTVNVLAENGNWNDKSKVTIIHATNQAITGQFDNLTTNLAFLTPYLDYSDPNRVILSLLRNSKKFEAIGSTYNQRGVGAGLSSLASGHPVLDAVIGMTEAQAKTAYDNLSGEIYGSTKSALITNSRYLRDAINGHLLENKQPTDQPIWFSTWGHNNNIDGDNNARGISNNGWGVTFGLDKHINEQLLAGITFGYENTQVNANGNRGKSDVDAYHLGTYLATEVSGIKLRGGLTYSYLDISTERKIPVKGLTGKAKDSYNGWQLQAFTEANYDFAINKNLTLSPYVNLAHVWLHLDKAREHGSLAALQVNKNRDDVTFSTLGVRSQLKLNTKMPISLYSDLGWQYAYGDTEGKNHHSFLGAGNSFAIKGVGVNKNTAIIGAGVNAEITHNASIRLGYQGQLSNNFKDHSANLTWTLAF